MHLRMLLLHHTMIDEVVTQDVPSPKFKMGALASRSLNKSTRSIGEMTRIVTAT